MRQLIVNADDFGLHELINEGIVQSHADGCVTSTTIMAGGSAFGHAVALAKQHPRLGVGVHLTLVGAKPVAKDDVHTLLTPDGTLFPTYQEFIQKYTFGLISKKHIEYELQCQMHKVARCGIRITHVDSHQHLHALPGMANIIGKIIKDFQVYKVRIPGEPWNYFDPYYFSLRRILSRTALSACAFYSRMNYINQGLYSPQNFYGMLAGGRMSQSSLMHVISNLPEGVTEIMVHPGKNTQALNQVFSTGYHWQEEMEALKSKEIQKAIQVSNIQLATYRDVIITQPPELGDSGN